MPVASQTHVEGFVMFCVYFRPICFGDLNRFQSHSSLRSVGISAELTVKNVGCPASSPKITTSLLRFCENLVSLSVAFQDMHQNDIWKVMMAIQPPEMAVVAVAHWNLVDTSVL